MSRQANSNLGFVCFNIPSCFTAITTLPPRDNGGHVWSILSLALFFFFFNTIPRCLLLPKEKRNSLPIKSTLLRFFIDLLCASLFSKNLLICFCFRPDHREYIDESGESQQRNLSHCKYKLAAPG